MKWKGKLEATVLFVMSLGLYNVAIGPILVILNPMFAGQTPATVAFIVTFIVIVVSYFTVKEYRFDGKLT